MTAPANNYPKGTYVKKFRGKTLSGKVVSVHSGNNEDLSKDTRGSLTAEIGGFAGDNHHGLTRKAWKVDWQPASTVRRNERQWSGVSVEELAHIADRLALTEPLAPDTLGANLCVEGISEFSLLRKAPNCCFHPERYCWWKNTTRHAPRWGTASWQSMSRAQASH